MQGSKPRPEHSRVRAHSANHSYRYLSFDILIIKPFHQYLKNVCAAHDIDVFNLEIYIIIIEH